MSKEISQNEIDQLVNVLTGSSAEPDLSSLGMGSGVREQKQVKTYDFKRPDKFSKEQVRTVQIMHESFARLASTTLSAQLRNMVDVNVQSVDQLTYEEYQRSLRPNTAVAIIDMHPLRGSAILEIDSSISFSIIDRLMGGNGESEEMNRELSDIEQIVIESIIVRILGNLREAWTQVIELNPRLAQIETNPQFAQIVSSNEMVILVAMSTKIGNVEGPMNLCIPYLTIEPIISKLSSQYLFTSIRKEATTENMNILRERLAAVNIPIIAEIGSVNFKLEDIVKLEVGDFVRLPNVSKKDPMVVKIGKRPKFECKPGLVGNKVAVQITKKLEEISMDDFEELTTEVEDL